MDRLEREIERVLADTPTGDGSAARLPPVTSDQIEYDWLRWRGWRRLVGAESFFYKWRSDGGRVPQ